MQEKIISIFTLSQNIYYFVDVNKNESFFEDLNNKSEI